MALQTVLEAVALILGIAVLLYSSDKAVEHSGKLARAMGASPFMTGLVLVSLGTDLPEIVNSLVADAAGHADISLGDSLGSALAQVTLVLGLLPFLGRGFKVKRRDVLVIGTCEVLALAMVVSMARKCHFTRMNGIFLVASWPVWLLLSRAITGRKGPEQAHPLDPPGGDRARYLAIAVFGFVGVAIAAYAVTQSVIMLSEDLGVPEYIISFFAIGIGTSLPELVVDLAAIRNKQYELAIGDIIGSSLVDATVSIGIGQIFFPQAVSGELIVTTGLYVILASTLVILTLAWRGKVDRRAGALYILTYAASYLVPLLKESIL